MGKLNIFEKVEKFLKNLFTFPEIVI